MERDRDGGLKRDKASHDKRKRYREAGMDGDGRARERGVVV